MVLIDHQFFKTTMSGKIKPMHQIKQLIIHRRQGKGYKTIARILGISKNTVKEYVRKVELLTSLDKGKKWDLNSLLKLSDPELEALLFAGNPSYKEDPQYTAFKDKVPYFEKELQRVGVTRKLLWEEYNLAHPASYSYSQFCYHLRQFSKVSKSTLVLDHKPAEKLQVDFAGKPLSYVDRETGEVITCQVFIACLPYSNYTFAMAVPSQKIADFLHALSCCLSDLGGVPETLVPDNLKSAVTKTSSYAPVINPALADFANHYDMAVVPARPYKPRDKGGVENHVKVIYSHVYAKLRDRQFFDIHSLNQAIKEKVKDLNQTRMQNKPYCREESFLAEDKKNLKPLL